MSTCIASARVRGLGARPTSDTLHRLTRQSFASTGPRLDSYKTPGSSVLLGPPTIFKKNPVHLLQATIRAATAPTGRPVARRLPETIPSRGTAPECGSRFIYAGGWTSFSAPRCSHDPAGFPVRDSVGSTPSNGRTRERGRRRVPDLHQVPPCGSLRRQTSSPPTDMLWVRRRADMKPRWGVWIYFRAPPSRFRMPSDRDAEADGPHDRRRALMLDECEPRAERQATAATSKHQAEGNRASTPFQKFYQPRDPTSRRGSRAGRPPRE